MEERDDTIVLIDENGEEVEFEHLDTIELNDNRYIVLLPVEEDEETDEVIILKVEVNDQGEESFISVDDEDEINEVFEEFKLRAGDQFDFDEEEDEE